MSSTIDLCDNKGTFKYFIGYDNYRIGITPLCIMLSQMNTCVKYFKDNKHMNLLVNDKKTLQKYNEIGIKLKIYLKKYLIVNQCLWINILKQKNV